MVEDNLVPYFMPSLSAVLVAAEDKKCEPLTYDEAISIRDDAQCIMMEKSDAHKMDESRGYKDLDPENLWYEWQMLRREMQRKPDIDPGPSFAQINSADAGYQRATEMAQKTVNDLIRIINSPSYGPFIAMIKIKLSDGDKSVFMWLSVVDHADDQFTGKIFEAPEFFPNVKVGQSFTVPISDIVDWMYNENGVLNGGFSIRHHRSTLPEQEKTVLDEHLGVTRYA